MRRLLPALAALAFFAGASPSAAQVFIIASCGTVPAAQATLTAGNTGEMFVDTSGRLCGMAAQMSQYPAGATPITASATGTTLATTATLAGVAAKTTFLCGFSIRANATAAATGNATVTGTITGTLNFTQWTAPLASGLGVTEPPIGPACIPASAVNTGVAVVSAAPGAGGTVSVSAWGYQL